MSFGRPHRHWRSIDSTNERARALVESGAPSGTILTAEEQEAGRGRHGRRWSAPACTALLCSAILRPLEPGHRLLPLAVPLAVCDAIEALAPVECRLKWPNDVWIAERKVAGVLIEARPPEWAVIGIGINVAVPDEAFPRDLRWPATSVGHGATVAEMLSCLCAALDRWVAAEPREVVDAYSRRDALHGRRVAWDGGEGEGAGVDGDGNLLVETSGGTVALGAGEVSLRL